MDEIQGARDPRRRKRTGWRTLAGLGLVAACLGLGWMVMPRIASAFARTACSKIETDFQAIESALETYAAANRGEYPRSIEVLVTPDLNGHTFLDRNTVPLDAWRHPYVYVPPSDADPRPRVVCYGADGKPGGDGDAADVDNRSRHDR